MTDRVDLFDSTYGNFTERVLALVRSETFGDDIGQNSWLTVDEYKRFIDWAAVKPDHHVLEVASGSGGPALFLARKTGCRVSGIDSNELGVDAATKQALASDLAETVRFSVGDATRDLPFETGAFDAVFCIDSMNHFTDRLAVFKEWYRVLRPGGRAVFTDPVVITGPVTNDELALRSSIGVFLFVPSGTNEQMIRQAGFRLVRQEDVSDNAANVADRWLQAREAHKADLIEIEGEERFEGLQKFFGAVHTLTGQRRLSRIAYVAEKPI